MRRPLGSLLPLTLLLALDFGDASQPATVKFNDKCYRGSRATFGPRLPEKKPFLTLPVLRGFPADGCSDDLQVNKSFLPEAPNEFVLLLERGTCFFKIKSCNARKVPGARAVIITSNDSQYFQMADSNDTCTGLEFPSLMISVNTTQKMFENTPIPSVTLYEAPDNTDVPLVDGSTFVIWGLANFTLLVACWRASEAERRKACGRAPPSVHLGEVPEATQSINMWAALGFVVFASAMLVLLFFVIKHIMMFIIVMFCISGCTGILFFGKMYIHQLGAVFRKSYEIKWLEEEITIGTMILTPFAIALVTVWACFRFESWAWALQDFMAFSLCIYFLCVIRMPNIKVASALLILAFLYDIFWVFLSPYLFSSSVMVTVATGGDHEPKGGGDDEFPCNPEPIPMLFKIPHMYAGGARNYSLLGLGDVVLPGLLVAFCLRYDYHAHNSWRKGYFVPVYIGYCIGLGMANAAVIITRLGQPALLYLVPCTLGPLYALAWRDKTLSALWKGPFDEDHHHELQEALNDSPASEDSTEQNDDEVGLVRDRTD